MSYTSRARPDHQARHFLYVHDRRTRHLCWLSLEGTAAPTAYRGSPERARSPTKIFWWASTSTRATSHVHVPCRFPHYRVSKGFSHMNCTQNGPVSQQLAPAENLAGDFATDRSPDGPWPYAPRRFIPAEPRQLFPHQAPCWPGSFGMVDGTTTPLSLRTASNTLPLSINVGNTMPDCVNRGSNPATIGRSSGSYSG